ncbi:hypothetical protein C2E23DRAFT_216312 [Lenzites betulinus]|nr:hypothetical protein C2E23DRAFT_216312 [Lenzites betulinus]
MFRSCLKHAYPCSVRVRAPVSRISAPLESQPPGVYNLDLAPSLSFIRTPTIDASLRPPEASRCAHCRSGARSPRKGLTARRVALCRPSRSTNNPGPRPHLRGRRAATVLAYIRRHYPTTLGARTTSTSSRDAEGRLILSPSARQGRTASWWSFGGSPRELYTGRGREDRRLFGGRARSGMARTMCEVVYILYSFFIRGESTAHHPGTGREAAWSTMYPAIVALLSGGVVCLDRGQRARSGPEGATCGVEPCGPLGDHRSSRFPAPSNMPPTFIQYRPNL